MAPDLAAPLSAPRSRPRAATAMQPTTTSPPLSSRRPSQVMGTPLTSLPASVYTGSSNENGSVRSASGRPITPPQTTHSVRPALDARARARSNGSPPSNPSPRLPIDSAQVNRLSRELSLLRQQTASVASTTSSASTTPFNDSVEYLANPAAHPATTRRHRSSSSLSASYIPAIQESRTGSVTGIAPSRDACLPSPRSTDAARSTRSRAPSFTSPRQPDPGSPLDISGAYPHRSSLSQQRSRTASITRPEELESIKRENEMLRRRVRELELTVRKLREGAAPRDERSDGGSVPSGAGQGNAS
ncbi:predicted protein [Aspergillus terreus NIH2624]|uniref:Uncharacterized protein n=1 Tax=Aspergillus terreus (strain NIH 2624 / FGSC A1156) TaxID=341663 RepID=Q0CPE5_ASPTN|nr:uncharacterized protein ATEG_04439 [Aspergillus terreus NIH2624]EAU34886.1 predicted protein [Aspergillus terreus NIH2624]